MSDCEIIILSLVGETIGIDSENCLFGKIKSDHIHDFPNLIHRSRFNRRRRRLVDSTPVPICKNARITRSKICKDDYESAPDRGYSAVNKAYFYGFKLHLATSVRGVYSSMELTKVSIHDIHFLNEIKHSKIGDCALIGDKGYVSEPIQQDLFTTRQIRLFTPVKSNQHDKERIPIIFMKSRKRFETLFSQLCDQLMLKRNYAKTTKGLSVRILCKIT